MDDKARTDSFPQFNSKANKEQRQAIEHQTGPLLVIAGPGSGKTFTLVERLIYLITQKSAVPNSLLILTFGIQRPSLSRGCSSPRFKEDQWNRRSRTAVMRFSDNHEADRARLAPNEPQKL
jgi:UvrD-like helicase family protein